ncbi:MAG: hypothetical protein AAF620_20200, partial [Bacteroidota bacterium]
VRKYKEHTGNLPLRMVLHKTSKFSSEEEGFYDAFHEIPIVEANQLDAHTHTTRTNRRISSEKKDTL